MKKYLLLSVTSCLLSLCFTQSIQIGGSQFNNLFRQQNPKTAYYPTTSSFGSFGLYVGYEHTNRKGKKYFYSFDLANYTYGFEYKTKPDDIIFTKFINGAETELQLNALRLFPISLTKRIDFQFGVGPSFRFSPIGYSSSMYDEYYLIDADKIIYAYAYHNQFPVTVALNTLLQTEFKVNDALKIVVVGQYQQGVWKAHRLDVSYAQFTNNEQVDSAQGTFWGRGSRWGLHLGLKYKLNFSKNEKAN